MLDELSYKADVVDRTLAELATYEDSALRQIHLTLEADAQSVWRSRLRLHASDLVRFGRTNWVWRNNQVEMLDADSGCQAMLAAFGNPQVGLDMAMNAGNRNVALATVTSVIPLRLKVESRRFGDGTVAVALRINGTQCVESPTTTLKIQGGSFKFGELHVGDLIADDDSTGKGDLRWDARIPPDVDVGDALVLADASWFGKPFKSRKEIAVPRPKADTSSAPKPDCDADSFASDPENHMWCCRSHEEGEAEWSDELADRRARGELNPEAWPPVIDIDHFDTLADGTPVAESVGAQDAGLPDPGLTIDDLD